jgi:hypothetical protein
MVQEAESVQFVLNNRYEISEFDNVQFKSMRGVNDVVFSTYCLKLQ